MRTSAISAIKYSSYLEARANEIKQTRSGEKTKLKLLASTARLLATKAQQEVSVVDIARGAGMAKGTFYIYFETKEDMLLELLESYIAFEWQTFPILEAIEENYRATYTFVEWYEGAFASNSGLLRCLVQLNDIDERFQTLWLNRNNKIVDRLLSDNKRRLGVTSDVDSELLRKVIHALGAAMDQTLFTRYGVHRLVESHKTPNPMESIELHAVLNYRAMYLKNPPKGAMIFTKPLLEMQASS